ncbi:hypothetical protein EVAR_65715_1 [Eumeta japonica]|uniref:Uncharacterized protein n=1 Tax=Eumeta variegata TaxID=151549 RepID=A0A4C2ABL5_EUMVA|nr:hypothetical protein EVAR_65715_1 [Eumeta japonica]
MTSKGCIQGSIAGPTFGISSWTPYSKNSGTSAYTCRRSRTTWSLCFGQSASVLEAEANRALAHVSGWGDRNKLRHSQGGQGHMGIESDSEDDLRRRDRAYRHVRIVRLGTGGK